MPRLKEQYFLWRVVTYNDREAFTELYNLYHRPVYQFLAFRLGKREDAEDLGAQVFLKTWEYLTSEKKEVRNFRAFIYTLARNLIADFYKQKGSTQTMSLDEADEAGKSIDIPDTKDLFEQQARAYDLLQVQQAIAQIPAQYQEVVMLRHFAGLKVKEIAEVIEKSPGATAVLLHRGMETLARRIQEKNPSNAAKDNAASQQP